MFKYLVQIWKTKDLRNRIFFTIGVLILFRLLTQITIPGANLEAIRSIFQRNTILGIFSALTGGSAENFSIVLMGLSPYINASIIIQLLTVIIPRLEALSKEGEQGYRQLNKYTRWLTIPLAFLQSYGTILLLNSQSQVPIIENVSEPSVIIPIMLTITTGTIFLMWLGEIMSEYGIGNGISLLIFTGIVSGMPQIIGQSLFLAQTERSQLISFVVGILFTIITLVIIVLVNEGQRKIPITYASHRVPGRGEQSFIPIRIAQAGMIPIIFAVSLVSFPGLLGQFFQNSSSEQLKVISSFLQVHFSPNAPLYITLYFLFIIAFTYFYVSITFNPDQVSENIQKRGGFIPGIRPGKQTAEYLGKVSNRLNLFGGVFLAVIAVAPILLGVFGSSQASAIPSLISGAGMIIIVGVVLDLVRQINAQLIMHDYERLV